VALDPQNQACDRNESGNQDKHGLSIMRMKLSNFLLVSHACQYCHGSMEMGPSTTLFTEDMQNPGMLEVCKHYNVFLFNIFKIS